MNLTSERAVVAEILHKLFAVCDSLKIAIEVDPDPTPSFISRKNFCIAVPQIDLVMNATRLSERVCRDFAPWRE